MVINRIINNGVILAISTLIMCSIPVQIQSKEVKGFKADLNQEQKVQANYLTFGLPGWAEVMIGFAVGTPMQALKLFFPFSCAKSGLEIAFESFDFYIFYNQMTIGVESNKNLLFAVMSLLSVIIEFPQILSNCIPGQGQSDLGRLSQTFSDSILELLKTVIYLDTSFNLLFQQEWFFSGYYGMYALLNLVSFIAFFALNT